VGVRAVLAGVVLAASSLGSACSSGNNDQAGTRDSAAGAKAGANAATGTGAAAPQSTAGGVGAADAAARIPRVVFLGTSLTAGLGLDPDQAYPAVLQRVADSAGVAMRIVNAGLSGETSAGALRRAGWVLDQPAALVVLEVGANDGLRGVDPDSTHANLLRLIDTVRTHRPEARIALVQMEAPTNLGRDYTTRFHAAFERAAREKGVPLWPFLLEGVAGVASLNQGDGIHPNREGAVRVAGTLWPALSRTLAEPATGSR